MERHTDVTDAERAAAAKAGERYKAAMLEVQQAKDDAVFLYQTTNLSGRAIATEFGVTGPGFYRWVSKANGKANA